MGASANPLALRATLEYQGSLKDIRKSIANAGLLPFTDPSLRSDVREAIEGQPGEACTFLSPFKLLDKLSTLTSGPRKSTDAGIARALMALTA